MVLQTPTVDLRWLVVAAQCLLVVAGVGYSGLAAWSGYLAGRAGEAGSLRTALEWQERLGLDGRKTALALAELHPEQEEEYLLKAAVGEHPPVDALVRLSIRAEFAGREAQARQYMDRAVEGSRKYRVFLAAATQAERMGDEERLLRQASAALRYCPRDADDIFGLLVKAPRGGDVMAKAKREQREEYLRFLIGRQEYLAALEYQAALERNGRVEALRRELAERFVVGRQWAEALRLYDGPPAGGIVNARFEQQPTSLGFDWRLAQGEGVRTEWFPGRMRVRLETRERAREVMSQFVKRSGSRAPRVEARWTGEVAGLRWQSERLNDDWIRVALVAEAGARVAFEIEEVRLRAED